MEIAAHRGEAFPEIRLRPVGIVRNEIKEPSLVAECGDLEWRAKAEKRRRDRSMISELVIENGLEGILDGVEDFSHLLVLYWAHLVPSEARRVKKVHPIGRKDLPLVGVFSTCSPVRPNPILVTAVRLLERRANVLRVKGLEAIEGSPILDIKPYVPSYYSAHEVRLSNWMKRIEQEISET